MATKSFSEKISSLFSERMNSFLEENNINTRYSYKDFLLELKFDHSEDKNKNQSQSAQVPTRKIFENDYHQNFRLIFSDPDLSYEISNCLTFKQHDSKENANNYKLCYSINKSIDKVLPEIVEIYKSDLLKKENDSREMFYQCEDSPTSDKSYDMPFVLLCMKKFDGEDIDKRVGKDSRFTSYEGTEFEIDTTNFPELSLDQKEVLEKVQNLLKDFTEYKSSSDYMYTGGTSYRNEKIYYLPYASRKISYYLRYYKSYTSADHCLSHIKDNINKKRTLISSSPHQFTLENYYKVIKSLIFIHYNKDAKDLIISNLFWSKLVGFKEKWPTYLYGMEDRKFSDEVNNIFNRERTKEGSAALASFFSNNSIVINEFCSENIADYTDRVFDKMIVNSAFDTEFLYLPNLIKFFEHLRN